MVVKKTTVPAWVPCPDCDEFWCTIHEKHTFECACPEVDEWPVSPYEKGSGVVVISGHNKGV